MYQQPTTNRPFKVFTWHVHGTYLYYLSQANVDFYLPVGRDAMGYNGKSGPFPYGDNVHEIPVEHVRDCEFDAILFQSRSHYESDQYELFSETQHRLPKLYLEHDPPREHPTDTPHPFNEPNGIVVHVTDFNRLMWNTEGIPSVVIDHGVVDPQVNYKGTLERGIVVINNLKLRGRRLGVDLYEYVSRHVPIDLIGMNAQELPGGLEEVPHDHIPEFISQYRFFFNPIRYTSMGLAVIEAMLVGIPVVGFQTTEMVSVFQTGVNGYLSLQPDKLIEYMKLLLDSPGLARTIGKNGRHTALQRFNIPRFTRDWEALFHLVKRGRQPAPFLADTTSVPA
jgi:glycosyltransferase involved in cell wall biosynthesis